MNAECPRCTEADQAVSVPLALADTTHPLGEPERSLLLPPPPPAPAVVGRSKPAVALYAVAAVITVLGLKSMADGLSGPQDADLAYRLGAILGPLFFSVPLALAGMVVQLTTRRRRVRAAEAGAEARRAVWERCHRVWQAAWLCRRCRTAFFPKGSVTPDFPASPAIAVAQVPSWVTATAERALGVPEPAAVRPVPSGDRSS
ncbi:hypothetical protein [Kitasatospora sp. NPDC088346]|uniref:hypothetical protein n=1 Tax=Kitasatospora sp. NPDC088346 TaxID=3364073 RepID=UPI003820D0A0